MENKKVEKNQIYYDITDIDYRREISYRVTYPFYTLNKLTGGGEEGSINIITSQSDNGKSTLMMQFITQFIKDNEKVYAIFGEHTMRKAQSILYKQISMYNAETWKYVKYEKNGKPTGIGESFISEDDEIKAIDFFKGKLFLHNTMNDLTIDNVLNAFNKAKQEQGCKIFVLDNFMQITYQTNNELQEQRDIAEELRLWALRNKTIVYIIMHLKKYTDRETIRCTLDDIAGSSNIPNKASTVISIIRTNKLDKNSRAYKNFDDLLAMNQYDINLTDAVLEVLKTKNGKLGFVGLRYYESTKTFRENDRLDKDKPEEEKEDDKRPILYNTTQNTGKLIPLDDIDLDNIF